jgi:hypothetical protein
MLDARLTARWYSTDSLKLFFHWEAVVLYFRRFSFRPFRRWLAASMVGLLIPLLLGGCGDSTGPTGNPAGPTVMYHVEGTVTHGLARRALEGAEIHLSMLVPRSLDVHNSDPVLTDSTGWYEIDWVPSEKCQFLRVYAYSVPPLQGGWIEMNKDLSCSLTDQAADFHFETEVLEQ